MASQVDDTVPVHGNPTTASVRDNFSVIKSEITAIQSFIDGLGTAAHLDVPVSGNASTTQVVKGDDTRLTNSRTPTAHTHVSTEIVDSTIIGRSLLTSDDAAAARAALDVLALDGSSEMRGVVQWRQQTSGDFYPVTYAAQKNYAGDIIRSATIGQWSSGAVLYAQDTLALAPNRSYAWEYCIGETRIAAVTAGTDSAGNVSGSEISAQILRVRTAGGTEGMRLRSASNAVKVDVFDAANQYTGDVLEISTVLNSRTVRLYGPVILAAYTVAALPLAPPEGATAYATNGRKSGEGAGAGTGVPVYYSAGKWRVYRDDSEVQA